MAGPNTELKEKVMSLFGERLRQAREAAGFADAEDFAIAIGVRGPTYRYWERGDALPNLTMLTRICQALQREPNYFLPLALSKEAAKEAKKAPQQPATPKKKKKEVGGGSGNPQQRVA